MRKIIANMPKQLSIVGLGTLSVAFFIQVVQILFPVVNVFINKYLTNALLEQKIYTVFVLVGFLIIMWILEIIFSGFSQNINQMAGAKATDFDIIQISKKVASLNIDFWEVPHNQDLMNKANQSKGVYYYLYRDMSNYIILISVTVVSIYSMFRIVPISILIVAILSIVNIILTLKWVELEYMQNVKNLESDRKRGYYRSLIYNRETEKEIKAFNVGAWLLDKYDIVSKDIFSKMHKMSVKNARSIVILDFVSMIIKILIWIYVGIQTLDGKIAIGDCVLFIGLWNYALNNIVSIRNSSFGIYHNIKDANDLNKVYEIHIEENNKETYTPKKIEYKDISFKYPSRGTYALKNVNLRFVAGECYLIIGANGAGKSTLIKLLLKHYRPSEGKIIVNDKYDLNDISNLHIGYMAQNDPRFCLSISENVVLGSIFDKDRFNNVSSKAKLQPIIHDLSAGKESLVGKSYGEGGDLSGGQWQTISFARLLYHDCDLIILDEPSSGLDPIAEQKLYNEIKTLFKNKIVILISHRLNSISIANKIILISNGEVKGVGSHSELISKCKEYKEMYEIQEDILNIVG